MVVVTLVGELLAKENEVIVYFGPLSECRECKLKTVCFNLDLGHWYKVVSVREVHHECKIHEEGVRVVEVEAFDIPAVIQSKIAVEGTMLKFESPKCSSISCANFRLCHPIGVSDGNKYTISSVFDDVDCEEGKNLKRVHLK